MALSPMMQQYNSIKSEYQDCLLMFRLGDFYELFFDDALTASKELELTLTGRNCGLEERAPMCGVPFHAADNYIAQLVKAGYKVAICEQVQDPKEAKGIVERDVIRVYTPGTLDISISDEADESIYVSAVCIGRSSTALAFADVTTGEFFATEFDDNAGFDNLIAQLSRYAPRELLISDSLDKAADAIEKNLQKIYLNRIDYSYFKYESCEKAVMNQFASSSLISLGIDDSREIVQAAGALIMYLNETQKQMPAQITEFTVKNAEDSMLLDRNTMRNLELLETLYDKEVRGSLLGVLNKTRTAMGQRLLKKFIREPLKDSVKINDRLDAVEALKNNPDSTRQLRDSFKHVYDFERLTARIASGRANARDLLALKTTLYELPGIVMTLDGIDTALLSRVRNSISDFDSLYELLDSSISDDPPFTITEGGLIKQYYSEELDDLKASIKDAKLWIANLEQTERERTGIKTIKVGYNKVFGYYIDVSKGMIDKVPEHYIRKQTLVNNERYITPELKEKEVLVTSAEVKINKLEHELFKKIRAEVEPYIEPLQKASSAVALLDVLTSFAIIAGEYGYIRPIVDNSDNLDIRKGRHPAVENLIGSGMFVPNDTLINTTDRSFLMITGPNMAGKSTYMRQTAVIVIMAQIGCFVPADYAHIGVVDRVLTRIGASDNLAYGQSTFFIEMSELAAILRNSTERSLIILDEIGRGTSTFDGLSIAWATTEYLASEGHRTRTMFATHYHELTELSETYPSIHNLSVQVAEDHKDIVFLHSIVEGPASKSYGIQVAKLAGVPAEIRREAAKKLKELESSSPSANRQLSFFMDNFDSFDSFNTDAEAESSKYDDIIDSISAIDINNLTPLGAMNKLSEIIEAVKERG